MNASLGIEHVPLYLLLSLSAVVAWEGSMTFYFSQNRLHEQKNPLISYLLWLTLGVVLLFSVGGALWAIIGTFGVYPFALVVVVGTILSIIAPLLPRYSRLGRKFSIPQVLTLANAISISLLLLAYIYVAVMNLLGANIQIRIGRYVLES